VGVAVEVALRQDLRGVMESLVLDEDRAEDGALRLDTMRERPLECAGIGRQSLVLS
jgi:hypothetical protein